jgi:uncharacterized protein (TIGR03083 family)
MQPDDTRMQPGEYVDAIRTNATALVDAAEAAGLAAPVPACPDWDVAELLAHIGRVHRWATANATRAPDAEFPGWSSSIDTPDAVDRPEWVRAGAAELADTLAARPADTPAWSFLPPSTVGFWQRRQAHETAMHRVDAQLAAGSAEPIDASLAADGIDEWVGMLAAMGLHQRFGGSGETVHFHCTDVDGEWLVRIDPDQVVIERQHAKGDVAARGAASELLCWLQGRAPIERLEVFGDVSLLDRWREHAKF